LDWVAADATAREMFVLALGDAADDKLIESNSDLVDANSGLVDDYSVAADLLIESALTRRYS